MFSVFLFCENLKLHHELHTIFQLYLFMVSHSWEISRAGYKLMLGELYVSYQSMLRIIRGYSTSAIQMAKLEWLLTL